MDILVVLLLIAVLVAVVWELRARGRDGLERELSHLQQEMQDTRQALQGQVNSLDERVSQRLNTVQQSMTNSLATTTSTLTQVFQELGQLSASAKQMLEIGKDISSLQDLLKPPKLRGELGEFLLENLLAQVLPSGHYQCQYRFRSGEAVDAVIHIAGKMVPVDSKFPLESFQRLRTASSDQEERDARRDFDRDVKAHIDRVAKYILPDEGTLGFALMYIPAENIYYEIIVKPGPAGDSDLVTYAWVKRVIPVSPNTLYAYLEAIALGLKGLQVEEKARQVVELLERLGQDFQRFRKDFETLGSHLSHAGSKYADLDRQVMRLGDSLSRPLEIGLRQLPAGDEAGMENQPPQVL